MPLDDVPPVGSDAFCKLADPAGLTILFIGRHQRGILCVSRGTLSSLSLSGSLLSDSSRSFTSNLIGSGSTICLAGADDGNRHGHRDNG